MAAPVAADPIAWASAVIRPSRIAPWDVPDLLCGRDFRRQGWALVACPPVATAYASGALVDETASVTRRRGDGPPPSSDRARQQTPKGIGIPHGAKPVAV